MLKREAQVVVNVLVVRIGSDLFLECGGGIVELAETQIGEAEIIPALLAFRINFDGVLKKRNGFAGIAGIERGDACFQKFVGADGGRNGGRAGGGIFDDEKLGFVGFDGARKCQVIAGARGGKFAHFEIQGALRGEDVIFEVVAGFEIGVIAFDGNGDGSARGEIGGQRHFQIHGDVERAAEMDRVGGVFGSVRQADGEQGDADFGFLAGPVQVIRLREIQIELEGFRGVGRIARLSRW